MSNFSIEDIAAQIKSGKDKQRVYNNINAFIEMPNKNTRSTGFDIPQINNSNDKQYTRIVTYDDLNKVLSKCVENKICSFDFETGTKYKYLEGKEAGEEPLDPNANFVSTVSMSYEENQTAVAFLNHAGLVDGFQFLPEKDRETATQNFFEAFKEILENPEIVKIAHNNAFEQMNLLNYKIRALHNTVDTLVLAVRVDQAVFPERINNKKVPYVGRGLKTLVLNIIGHKMTTYEETLESTGYSEFWEIPADHPQALSYSAEDADYTLQLYNYYSYIAKQIKIETELKHIDKDGKEVILKRPWDNYYDMLLNVDMPFTACIAEMQYNGLSWNVEKEKVLEKKAIEKCDEAVSAIEKIAEKYNKQVSVGKNGGTKSLREFIFDELKAPVAKRSEKTGNPSLDFNAIVDTIFMLENKLDKIAEEKYLDIDVDENETRLTSKEKMKLKILNREEHAFKKDLIALLSSLQVLKKYQTLKNSHILGRKKFLHPVTNRIHSQYSVWTETGRLASSKPNGQNLPRGDNDPFGIRGLHCAEEEKLLYLIDFSGFELRIIAWAANETTMLKLFSEGGDLHRRTAAVLYGKKEEDVTKIERSHGKTGNFLKNYGGSARALQDDFKSNGIRKSIDDCQKILDAVDTAYPKLKDYAKKQAEFLRKNGFVETIYGYRRLIPEIYSRDRREKSSAERKASNTPIQGSAADICKYCMVRILRFIHESEKFKDVKMLANIHDEVVFELPCRDKEYVTEFNEIVKGIMEEPPLEGFTIDILADPSVALEWSNKQSIEEFFK